MVLAPAPAPATDHPLTAKEQASWLFQQWVPESGVLNVPFALRFPDRLRWWPLYTALRRLLRRHPALRTIFPDIDGTPARVVLSPDDPRAKVPLEVLASTTARLAEDTRRFAGRSFDVTRELPIRVAQFVTEDADVLVVVVNHITYDAYSGSVVRRELLASYHALETTSELPADLADEVTAPPPRPPDPASLAYWREHLAGAQEGRRDLAVGRYPQREPNLPGARISFPVSEPAARAVQQMSDRFSVTPNILMLAAYAVLLARHGMGSDVVIGLPIDARGARPHDAVGYHVNIVALRHRVDAARSFADLVKRCREVFLAGLLHARVSVDESFPGAYEQSLASRRPLFRHMFNFTGDLAGLSPEERKGLEVSLTPVFAGYSRLDLDLQVRTQNDGFLINAVYATDVFSRDEILAILARYDALLVACGAGVDRPLGELPLWTDEDRAVVARGNDTTAATAPDSALASILAAATRAPAAPAIVADGGTVTAGQLASTAAALAAELTARGLGAGDVVGVPARRGPQFVAAMLAAWRCGAAVLPVDPDASGDTQAQWLDAAGARLLVGGASLSARARRGRDDMAVPAFTNAVADVPAADEPAPDAVAQLCPVRAADGTTRLVRLTHGALANLAADLATRLALTADDTVAWGTGPAWDAGCAEFLPALAAGARLVVPDGNGDRAAALVRAVREGATVVPAAPLDLARMLDSGKAAPARVLCGHDPLPAALAERAAAAGVEVVCVRGVAESSGPALAGVPGDPAVVRPISGAWARVVDADGQELPPGLRGALYVGGMPVAAGYVDQSEQVTGRLAVGGDGERLVATGLDARWQADGSLRLASPDDTAAVAVQEALERHPAVRHVVVEAGDDGVVSYVELRSGTGAEIDVSAFGQEDRPARLVVVDRLPTLPTGGVDHAALRKPPAGGAAPAAAEAPAETAAETPDGDNALVGDLVDLWRTVLKQPQLAADADFFANGGNSLLAARLVSQIRKRTGAKVSLRTVFRAATPTKLADEVATVLSAGK